MKIADGGATLSVDIGFYTGVEAWARAATKALLEDA